MIFYYSATGNTRWAARQLAEATGEQLAYIPDVIGRKEPFAIEAGERIGFCFPVHGWRPPMMVRQFVRQLRIAMPDQPSDHYCYALCTAGDNIGETMKLLQRDLGCARLQADSLFSLIMPESYVGLPFMDVDTPEKEQRKKATAAQQLEAYAEAIVQRRKGQQKLTLGRWPKTNSRLIGAVFTRLLITDAPFHVVEDRCIRCGLCAEKCPSADIEGGKGLLPEWRHNGQCLTCFACYHHCPHHAIEFGRRTRHKGQYYFEKKP